MRRITSLFLLTALALVGFGCQSEETVQLPTLADEFIELNIDGQRLVLNAIPHRYGGFYSDYVREDARFRVVRSTADNRHIIQLSISGCNLRRGGNQKQIFGENATGGECPSGEYDLTISYTTLETGGTSGCPHLEGVPTELTGTITVDSWDDNGLMIGSYETTAHEDYVLSGDFRVYVEEI